MLLNSFCIIFTRTFIIAALFIFFVVFMFITCVVLSFYTSVQTCWFIWSHFTNCTGSVNLMIGWFVWCIGKCVEGSGHGLFEGILPVCAWWLIPE
jgi:hypothetical protein